MFDIYDMDKLDVIITLLLILISLNLIKLILNFIVNQITGRDELTIINFSIDKGNYEAALNRCNKQLLKAPGDSDLLWLNARILYKLGRMEEAKQSFEKLAIDESLWKKDANTYIESINNRT